MDMGRGEGRVRCMERVTWKLTLPYVKGRANGNLLCGSGNSNRGSVNKFFSIISLDSVYKCKNTIFIFIFLTYFTLYNRFYFHPSHQNWLKCITSYGWVIIFHCVYVPLLLCILIYWWTSRLLPCSSYCKECCNEKWDTHVFFNFGFLRVYA